MIKFGIQNGLNVARAGYSEDQILTACMLADRTGYDSVFYMDHTNVPQWKNAIVLDPWVMLSAIAAVTNHVELGTCVTDAIRRHPSNIALAAITLDRVSKGRAILGIVLLHWDMHYHMYSRMKVFLMDIHYLHVLL